MTVLTLCNVGARDVVVDGKVLKSAREEGRRLLDQYAEVAQDLAFPIVEPCLRYIIQQHPASEERPGGVDRLVLFGTDQPDPAYRTSDTLYFAELAARRLPELLGGHIHHAEPQYIQGINPALYDEAFEEFDELLSGLPGDDLEACYVILCGGIPACNTALLLQGVRHYGRRLRVVYLPHQGEAQELRVGQQLINTFQEAAAIEHLARLDFANAYPLVAGPDVDPGLAGLVAYAAQRLAFDFRSAQNTLLQALRDGTPSVRTFINNRLRHDLDPLLDDAEGPGRLKALLRELYWNAAITYSHRRYADFLGRVYRFQEAVLRYLVETILELPTDLKPEVRQANIARWRKGIQSNPALLAFLSKQIVEGKPLDWETIARPTYKALLSFATREGLGVDAAGESLLAPGERKRYEALLKRVNAFDGLVELRHRTIIGHDFVGVSQALLVRNYKGTPLPDGRRRLPMEGLAEIMGMLGVDVGDSPYRAVADFVTSHLRN